MIHRPLSIRAFIGARRYDESREFYGKMDFTEHVIDPTMSYFQVADNIGFYLQNSYVRDWVDNTMIFMEVDELDRHYEEIRTKDLPSQYKLVRLSAIRAEPWGREFFLHDPSGVLWHFGEFV